jgi:hypothetical protein
MRLRFTIRDLLWLILAAALGMSWWSDCRRLATANQRWADKYNELLQLKSPYNDQAAKLATERNYELMQALIAANEQIRLLTAGDKSEKGDKK